MTTEPNQTATLTDVAKAAASEQTATAAPVAATATAPSAADGLISIDDFGKVKLRVGQIVAAERIEKSEKLLKLQVDLGEESGPRQILAGIAKHYEPDAVIGRKIVVVANLKPAKLMGHASEGMLLAASDTNGNLELIFPGAAMPPGSTVR